MMGIAIISTYPPNRCGVGEFASYLRQGLIDLGETEVSVIAVADEYRTDYGPEVIRQIKSDNLKDYEVVAEFLNSDAIDAVILQHEFSMFGGPFGTYILELLKRLQKPVITTFHTIPQTPFTGGILASIASLSNKVIALSQYGRQLLHSTHNIIPEKTIVIPNGVPVFPTRTKEQLKDELMLTNKTTAMTFGLLTANKGIESVLFSIPEVAKTNSEFLYLIIGATHPKEVMLHGEIYRNTLSAIVDQLGIKDHVRFIPNYLSDREIMDYLIAADIFITPYHYLEQNSSATLTYAAYHGKACLSTPYFYAEELLGDGSGLLFPFNDISTLQNHLKYLVANPDIRTLLGDAVKKKTQNYAWIESANKYLDLIKPLKTG